MGGSRYLVKLVKVVRTLKKDKKIDHISCTLVQVQISAEGKTLGNSLLPIQILVHRVIRCCGSWQISRVQIGFRLEDGSVKKLCDNGLQRIKQPPFLDFS